MRNERNKRGRHKHGAAVLQEMSAERERICGGICAGSGHGGSHAARKARCRGRISPSAGVMPRMRAARAVLASIPVGRHWPSLHQFRSLSAERERFSICADKRIPLLIIGHVFDPADLFLKTFCFSGFIVGWLDKAHLPVLLEVQVILQTFISCIRSHFSVFALVLPF